MTGTTISNATTVGLVLTTIGQNPVTITAGGSVYSASSSGIYAGNGVAWNITNYGLVQAGSVNAPAIDFSTDAVGVTLTNAGTIEAQPGNTAVAFGSGDDLLVIDPGAEFVGYVDGGAGNNTLALASAASNGTLYGLSSKYTDFQSVTVAAGAYWNFNIIDVVGAGVVLTNAGTINVATGSYLKLAGGTLTNQSTGVINAYEIYGRLGPASSIVNVGLIASELGIFLKANDTVTNLGTILAHTTGYEQGYVVFADYGATVVNGASGNTTAVMSGDAGIRVSSIGSSVNSTITNFGTVIATGANQRAIQLDNGTITNGDPTDTAASLLGSGAGVYVGAVTIINYGTISASGTAGVHATQSAAYIYNLGSSALIEGYVGILASYGTITNAGTIASSQGTAGVAVQFAQAGDRLIIEPGATFVGTVAAVGIAGNTLELTSAATGGTLTGLGSSYLDFQSVTVDAGAYWSFTNDTVAVGVVLSNAGTINVPVASNDYIAGGTLINQTAGVIIGQGIYTALSEASSIDNIGLISNQYGIWLGGTDTVTNLGTILANAGNNLVIYGEFGGTIINGANGVTTALIEGAYGIEFGTGISTNYAVSVANYGTVTGTGINAGALEIQEQAVISNGASGDTVAQLRGGNWGVFLTAGTLTNYGTIDARHNIPGGAGVYDGASANLYNLGSAALIQGYYGINVAYGTITNAGTIASNLGGSGIALNFRSPGDSVVINPGAVFVGTVRAAGAIGNTLALASGSTSGTLSGLTHQYLNFQSVTVATNATWRFDGSDVVGDGLALTNAGTINMAAGSYLNFGGGTLTNQATGVINGSMFYAATGIAISIDNAGLIDTNYGIDAVGRATVTNLGTMLADGPGVRTGYAVRALHGAVIVNGASGVTTAVMRSQAGIVVFAGADSSYNGYVTNFGTIAAIEANPAAIDLVRGGSITNGDPTDTVASLLGGNFGASVNGATVTNYGTITEFTANAGGAGVYASQQAAHIYNLGSSALIEGYVGIRASSGTITNAGTIASSQGTTGVAVQFAQAGDRLIMQPGGTFVGTVEAAGVGNTLELSSAATAGTLTGLAANYLHFQFVTVDASADWNFAYDAVTTGVLLTNAGTINPLTDPGLIIAGGTLVNQTNGVIGGFGVAIAAGTVSNFGTIHATGSASGDAGVSAPVQAVVISNLGSLALIEGATGIIASYGTITNAGTIASTQGTSGVAVQFGFAGDRMIIEPGATFVGSVQAAGGGNTLELASAATAGTLTGLAADFENFQSVTVDAGAYWNFDSTDAVGNGVVLSNAGTIVPLSIYELYLTGGGLDNQSTGVIGGYGIYAERNFTSSIHNAGLINNSYGILLGGTGTVSNLGTVLAYGTAGGVGYTVHGFHGGTVVNGASGVATAVMRGDGGIKFQNGPNASYNGYVINFGTIAATGANARAIEVDRAGTIINGAPTDTSAALLGGEDGVFFATTGGTVANYGTISATAFTSNAAGVYGRVQAANISNLGSSALIEGYYGIISGAGTVTNGGTIASTRGPTGVAVQFRAPGDRLVIEPGARFIGTVAATGTVANTLALASGAGIGTLSALGTEYANFQSVTVAANAYWVLADNDTIGAGVVLTNAGTINTVDGNNEYLAGGALINQATGVIHGTGLYTSPGVSSSIDNIGLISNDYGVRLNGGSTVTNVGTILANATTGSAYGILGGHGGTVINGSTSVNTALIEGRAGIRILGGTDASFNGTVTNFGTILSTAHYGVALDQGGTITNGGGNALIEGYVGVAVHSGTVTNAGTIASSQGAAGVAVKFGSGANRLIIDPGAKFVGIVEGGLVGTDAIELAETTAGTFNGLGTNFINFGTVQIDPGARWSLTGNNTIASGGIFAVAGSLGITGSVTNDASFFIVGGTIGLASFADVGSGSTFTFAPLPLADPTLIVGGAVGGTTVAHTIHQFAGTDTIDLPALEFHADATAIVSGNTLAVVSNGATVDLAVAGLANGQSFATAQDGDGGLEIVACFVTGTRIRTPSGEVAVEALRVGDSVSTHGGHARAVRWIGWRSHAADMVAANPHLRPVRIRAHALAAGVPARDLLVSPSHALLVDEVLIPAGALVNDVSIVRDPAGAIAYFHIELDRHDVLLAEGAPAESYFEIAGRETFDNAADYVAPTGERLCSGLPRVEEGAIVHAARRRFAARAGVALALFSPGLLRGHVERIVASEDGTARTIEGWVLDEADPNEPVELDIITEAGPRLRLRLFANRYRPDLDFAGLAGGRCGFSLSLPGRGSVLVRRVADGAVLPMAA